MSDNTDKASRPLEGVRVLELGQLLAGPFAGCILGYFGAEVIKVEPPGKGDPIRGWRLVDDGTSYWWRSLARNKKSITLNLQTDEGRALARRLALKSDVIIENFKPGTMEKWGLGPEQLQADNPGLIYARVSGYGQTGPYSAKPGYASVCEGVGGFRHVNGFPDRPPVRPNLSVGDTLAGIHAALGVLLAYIQRGRNGGRGQVVDVAIYEAVFNLMEGVVPEYSGAGAIREPSGSTLTGIVPTNTYKCADGKYIIIGANGDSIFKRLCDAMGRPDLGSDPRLADNAGRVRHEPELDAVIAAWTGSLPSGEVLRILDDASVPGGPIYNVADQMADPHFRARGLFETVAGSGGKPLEIPAIVPFLSESPGRTDWGGEALGAHNDAVLSEVLGMSREEQARLRGSGVI